MTLLELLTLLVPITTAVIVSIITYLYAIKSKKFDLLYASKIPAFKEIAAKLTNFRSTCLGKVAEYRGMDFSPYQIAGSALMHRIEIANTVDENAIFLSKNNRDEITNLLNNIGILCSLELRLASDSQDVGDYTEIYQRLSDETKNLIELLYNDLNLK